MRKEDTGPGIWRVKRVKRALQSCIVVVRTMMFYELMV